MKKLHHKAKQYEIQKYDPTSLTWRPIAHSNDRAEAITIAERKPQHRVLDRLNRKVDFRN